ncbi:MAG: DUF2059 domain-containing protein [Nitratireductor sp.]
MKKVTLILSFISAMALASFSSFALEDTKENRLMLAEKLVQETVTSSIVKNMVDATWPPMEKNLLDQNPNIPRDALDGLKADLGDQQKQLIAELIVDMPRIYAKFFSTSDLEKILEFQTSEVGKKAVSLQPQIMAEIMPKMLKSIQENTPRIMQRMKDKIREKGYKL